ncbi:unnamed protein product, partial [Candidula unifasciata]
AHVLAVAVHPSGKLALSVGSDRSLLTWDLVTGKLAFQRKIKEAATNILFTSDGNHYILIYTKRVEICNLEDTSTVVEIPTSWRINSVCLIKNDVLAVGGDDRYIRLFDIFSGNELLTLDMAKPQEDSFSSRVRCICATVCGQRNLLVAATSSGSIKVFEVNLAEKTTDEVLSHAARVRVTCMAVHNSANGALEKGEPSEPRAKTQVKSQKKHVTETTSSQPEEEDVSEESASSDTGAVKVTPGQFQKQSSKDSAPKRNQKKRKQQQKTSVKGNQKRRTPAGETETSSRKTQSQKTKTVSTPASSGVRIPPTEPVHKAKKRRLNK